MVWAAVLERRVQLRRHARYREAAHQHTNGVLSVRESIRDASKMLSKEERYRAFTIFASLSARTILEGHPAVPFRLFYETCVDLGKLSDRSAKTVGGLLVHYRFASARVDPADGRRKLLVPGERMSSYIQAWSAPAYRALETLGRPHGFGDRDEEVLATFAFACEDYARAGLAFFGDDSDFARIFGLMEGGSLVCMSALSALFDDRQAPSRAEIAGRFSLSKAQVSQVIAAGRAAGFFSTAARIEPSEALVSIYLDCEATVLAFIDLQRERAIAELSAQGATRPREAGARAS